MTNYPKIAIVELNSQLDILTNMIAIENGIKTAKAQEATMVVLPENAFCFGNQRLASEYFEPLKEWCSTLANYYGIYLVAGTLPCPYRPTGQAVESNKFRQSSLLFDPAGQCIARYDKIHLFKATVNDSTGSYDESKTFEAGTELVVASTEFGKIGMMVCFDIRFATLAIRLRQLGADILTAPSAFTYQTGKAHWQSLLTARALDSQCMIIGAGQTGQHQVGKPPQLNYRETWGHSEIINANGEIVSQTVARNDPIPLAKFASNSSLLDNLADLPISRRALAWLPKSPNQSEEIAYDTNRVIMADFDKAAQSQWRNNIALLDSQKFSIIDPS